MSCDLGQLRLHGLIERLPGTHRYTATDRGFRLAVFLTRVHNRLLRPGPVQDPWPSSNRTAPLRREFHRLDALIEDITRKHRLIV
jgi:hypothetical protein